MSDQETREQLAGAAGSAMAGRTFDARDHHGRILRWRIECEPLVSKCGDEFVWAVVVAEYRQGIAVPPRGRKPTPKPWPVIKLPVDVLPNAEVRDRRPGASDLSATAIGGSLH